MLSSLSKTANRISPYFLRSAAGSKSQEKPLEKMNLEKDISPLFLDLGPEITSHISHGGDLGPRLDLLPSSSTSGFSLEFSEDLSDLSVPAVNSSLMGSELVSHMADASTISNGPLLDSSVGFSITEISKNSENRRACILCRTFGPFYGFIT